MNLSPCILYSLCWHFSFEEIFLQMSRLCFFRVLTNAWSFLRDQINNCVFSWEQHWRDVMIWFFKTTCCLKNKNKNYVICYGDFFLIYRFFTGERRPTFFKDMIKNPQWRSKQHQFNDHQNSKDDIVIYRSREDTETQIQKREASTSLQWWVNGLNIIEYFNLSCCQLLYTVSRKQAMTQK